MEKNKKIFPKNFYWGASTASHQVEGGTYNQWSEWELSNAKKLADNAEKRLGWMPSWERIKHKAQNPNNYVSGTGTNHYNLYRQDFRILKKLNLNSFRFGIEWSRLEPSEGTWDAEAFEHYKDYIEELLDLGIEPFLNIWHWTMPVWFTRKGGLTKKSNLKYFERFVEKLCQELPIKKLRYAITINEPNVYATFSYVTGEWVPNHRNIWEFINVYLNLARAHKSAYKILKKHNPKLQIGIATQLANIQAKRPHNLIDNFMTKYMRYYWNWWFINRIRKQQDFIGFNYYFSDYYKGFKRDNPQIPVNDLGWYMEPEGLYPLLLRVWSHYKKPIFVTENGLADDRDEQRRWWLEETMIAMERALSEGVDLRGYFHWSLLDNFEWAYGWWPKFGLVKVDRHNGMKRTIRSSAKWWADWLKDK